MADNLRHAQYGADGVQIDDPQKLSPSVTKVDSKFAFNDFPGIALTAPNRDTVYADILCNDSADAMRDRSGGGRHLIPGASAATAFSSAGYFTAAAGTNTHGFIPASMFSVDMAVDSFFVSMTVKMAAPGGNQSIAGFSNGSSSAGVYFSARAASAAILPVIAAGGAGYSGIVGYPATVVGVQCDGTDHNIQLAYDAPSRTAYYWADGAIKLVIPNCVIPGASSPSNLGFAVGAANDNNGGNVTSVAAQFKNIRMLKWEKSGLPINIGAIAHKSWAYPLIELTPQDIYAPASKRICLAWVGQSNEAGSSNIPDFTIGGVGAPQRDAITVTGLTSITPATASSFHCRLARLLGERSVWLDTLNSARGSTSITQHWCGQLLGWSASTSFGLGAYVVAANKVFKCTSIAASASIGTSGVSAPVWPGAGTVVDNELTWTFVRASTAFDVVGKVLTKEDPLFDPNGYLAAIASPLSARAVGEKIVAISLGQSDKTVNTSRAAFKAAYQSVTDWALALGYKVAIGFTCNGTTAGLNSWLTEIGQPGKNDALAAYSNNPSVFVGADLLASLGNLAVSTATVGLRADQLHMNNFARDKAADDWSEALRLAGY